MDVKTIPRRGKQSISAEVMQRLKPVIPPQDQWTPVDTALYGADDLYHIDQDEAEESRFKAIKYAFEHHFHNNEFYSRYCQGEGVTPETIKGPSDLIKIPLIPDTFFKTYPPGEGFVKWLQKVYTGNMPAVALKNNASFQDVMEALEEKGVTVTFTSGTGGRFSFIPRSRLTWMRQRYSIACGTMEIFGKTYDPERIFMQFAPNPLKTFIFIGRGSSAVHLALFSQENLHYIIDRKLTPDTIRISRGMTHGVREKLLARVAKYAQARIMAKFVKQLESFAGEKRRLILAGTPTLIETVAGMLEQKGTRLQLGENGMVVTGGGWKRPTGAPMSDKQFRARLKESWGVPEANCRDVYGMTECSFVFAGCEGHYKHVPHSIMYPVVLGDDMKPLPYGQYGRFAFLDPIPESYPGFIMTGDRVRILESCPVCDRLGPVIEPDISRMKGADERGCAAVMGQLVAKELAGSGRK